MRAAVFRETGPAEVPTIADAHRDVEQGHGPGKVAVLLATPDAAGWIGRLFTAWREGRPDQVAALFTPDAEYRSHPFRPAHLGRAAIGEYWLRSLQQQRDTQVHVGEPIVRGRQAAVEWWATLTEDGEAVSYAGTLFLTFDADGLCRALREVWTREPGHQRPYPGWGRWETER